MPRNGWTSPACRGRRSRRSPEPRRSCCPGPATWSSRSSRSPTRRPTVGARDRRGRHRPYGARHPRVQDRRKPWDHDRGAPRPAMGSGEPPGGGRRATSWSPAWWPGSVHRLTLRRRAGAPSPARRAGDVAIMLAAAATGLLGFVYCGGSVGRAEPAPEDPPSQVTDGRLPILAGPGRQTGPSAPKTRGGSQRAARCPGPEGGPIAPLRFVRDQGLVGDPAHLARRPGVRYYLVREVLAAPRAARRCGRSPVRSRSARRPT